MRWTSVARTAVVGLAVVAALGTAALAAGGPDAGSGRASGAAPELGQVPAPAGVLRTLPGGSGPGAPPRPGSTVDLLARHTDGGVTVGTYGWVDGSSACMTRFVSHPSPGQTSPEPAACGPLEQEWDRLGVSRSLGLHAGGQLKQVIWGFAPAGTAHVRLSDSGQHSLVVPVFDAGTAWRHGLHFVGTWPARVPVTVTALAVDGSELAQIDG